MRIFYLLVFLFAFSSEICGQPGPPPPDPGQPVPVQGIVFLIAAGAVLGIKKILGHKKEEN
jgi:hypothetical protein